PAWLTSSPAVPAATGQLGMCRSGVGCLTWRMGASSPASPAGWHTATPFATAGTAAAGMMRTEFIRAVPAHEPADAQDGDAEDSQGRNNKAFGLEKLLHVCPHSFLLLYKAYTAELTGFQQRR